jgi:hypothetical protein
MTIRMSKHTAFGRIWCAIFGHRCSGSHTVAPNGVWMWPCGRCGEQYRPNSLLGVLRLINREGYD